MSGTTAPASSDGGAGLFSTADWERAAEQRLSPDVWDFIAGGSGSEQSLAANRRALDRVALVPRVLSGVSRADTSVRLVSSPSSAPLAVAPMAYQCLVHPDGELAAARAAAAVGVPFVISTLSSRSIEEIAASGAELWFQLYWLRDRNGVLDLVRRAEESGCRALMVTVDVPVMGRRLRDVRNAFRLPASVRAANLAPGPTLAHQAASSTSAVAAHARVAFDATVSWADLEWLGQQTTLPIVVKGILDPSDAARSVELGARAVVVSNHGGRQLDGTVPSIAALPSVRAAVDGGAQVLLDSGVRSGTDVLRALALGATGVLVGRPVLWGLAVAGQNGVAQVLMLLRAELDDALLLAGCPGLTAAAGLGTALLPSGVR